MASDKVVKGHITHNKPKIKTHKKPIANPLTHPVGMGFWWVQKVQPIPIPTLTQSITRTGFETHYNDYLRLWL